MSFSVPPCAEVERPNRAYRRLRIPGTAVRYSPRPYTYANSYNWYDTTTTATSTNSIWLTNTTSSATFTNLTPYVRQMTINATVMSTAISNYAWTFNNVSREVRQMRSDRRLEARAFAGVSEDFLRREDRRMRIEQSRTPEAEQRAFLLLMSLLDEFGQAEYQEHRRVTIVGSHGGVYVVHEGWVANIVKLGLDGTPECRLCGHLAGEVPTSDNVAAQILAIKQDEEEYLRVANRHQLRQADLALVAA